MADTQKRITESFSIRRTRSQSKSRTKVTRLRSRNVSTRLFNLENDVGKDSEEVPELGFRPVPKERHDLLSTLSLTSRAKPSSKCVTDDSSLEPEIPVPNARRNLTSLFETYPKGNSSDENGKIKTPRKSARLSTPKKNILNSEANAFRTPEKCILTPFRESPRRFASSPSDKFFSTPKRDQENYSPNKTTKRQSPEQLHLVTTSPQKKKRESPQRRGAFSPVSLFTQDDTDASHSLTSSQPASQQDLLNDHQQWVLSPTKQSSNVTSSTTPKKLVRIRTRDQENYFSPNKTPKGHGTEQLRLTATSPWRKKESVQRKNTFTPVSLFKQDVSCFHAAKGALHCSTPSRLVSRERQMNDLKEFLEEHLTSGGKSGSLYVSGAPGTGKTACLEQLLEQLKEAHDFNCIFVNCMTLSQSRDIFEKILTGLGGKKGSSNKENIKMIEKLVCKRKKMIVLVLDEMDQLSSKNQQVLYSIFDWPRLPSSNLILIGIANSLDMTDRILPRLHTCGSRPVLLHFPPYSQTQITAILEDRLKDLASNGNCIIKPMALQFCARKIAAQTGDVRKALNTCRRAIELVEKSVRSQQVLRPTSDFGHNPGSPRRSPRKLSAQSVEVKHIMDVLHEIYGSRLVSSNASKSHVENSMPVQQKLLLCTLLLLTKHKQKLRDLTVGKLHEVYCKVCRVHKIENLGSADFHSVCELVETNGLLQIKKHKEARLAKVVLNVDEDELQFVMKDRSLLASILEDESVLKGVH